MKPLTEEQTEALVKKIVDGWDLDTLVQVAEENLFDFYWGDRGAALVEMQQMGWTLEDLESTEF